VEAETNSPLIGISTVFEAVLHHRRLERIVRAFRTAGINAKAKPQMDAWLRTHAAFEVPLGQAVRAAGGPVALADDPEAVRGMIRLMRHVPRVERLPIRLGCHGAG
jgi:hypothetical protein